MQVDTMQNSVGVQLAFDPVDGSLSFKGEMMELSVKTNKREGERGREREEAEVILTKLQKATN